MSAFSQIYPKRHLNGISMSSPLAPRGNNQRIIMREAPAALQSPLISSLISFLTYGRRRHRVSTF